jgi:hypothetical protein
MRPLICVLFLLATPVARAQDVWRDVLAGMPLRTNITELTASNYVNTMLGAFQSNDTVKALVVMPGAVDTFFWHRETTARLPPAPSTLLDAVVALTNQTRIRATFRPPGLFLHFDWDPLEPLFQIRDVPTAEKILARHFPAHAVFNDWDWDYLLPILKKAGGVTVAPKLHSRYSYHFYRSSFAAWNLNSWEALEVVSLATKTTFTVEKKKVTFKEDLRDPSAGPAQ